MDQNKSQAINYAFEVIPIMFHSQTADFFTYLERDGLKFLEFWWNYIGDQLPEEKRCPFEGMDYKIVKIDEKNTMAIVTLPQPHDEGEAYYILLVARPERRFAWVRLPNTRALVLVKKEAPENPNGTEIGEVTPRGLYVRIRKGPVPNIQTMTNIAMELIKRQPS